MKFERHDDEVRNPWGSSSEHMMKFRKHYHEVKYTLWSMENIMMLGNVNMERESNKSVSKYRDFFC